MNKLKVSHDRMNRLSSTYYFLTVSYYSSNFLEKLTETLPDLINLVVVNNSPDDNFNILTKQTNLKTSLIILESGENLGFGRGCNLGLQYIYDRHPQAIVWLINPDAYLKQVDLQQLQNLFSKYPQLSILGTTIYEPKGCLWFGGGLFNRSLGLIQDVDYRSKLVDQDYEPCDWVSGCSLMINLKNFKACPQFDSTYFLYYEDFDFCQRYLASGHTVGITDRCSVYHYPSSITGRNLYFKFQHSTYSYLVTIQRYSSTTILVLRLLRVIIIALIQLPYKPSICAGKLVGIWKWLQA